MPRRCWLIKPRVGPPVLDQAGNLLGILTLADIQSVPLAERAQRQVKDAMTREVLVAYPDDSLDEALEQLTSIMSVGCLL